MGVRVCRHWATAPSGPGLVLVYPGQLSGRLWKIQSPQVWVYLLSVRPGGPSARIRVHRTNLNLAVFQWDRFAKGEGRARKETLTVRVYPSTTIAGHSPGRGDEGLSELHLGGCALHEGEFIPMRGWLWSGGLLTRA